MLKSISNLISPKHRAATGWAREAYVRLVHEARNPDFYTRLGVPDTEDGRFDMILLHVAIETWCLLQCQPPEKLKAQALFDALFLDMDMALRQIGVGDLGVPHHMRRMMKAYRGRYFAYAESFSSAEKLSEAIKRNLYRKTENVTDETVREMTQYVLARVKQNISEAA